MEDVSCVMEALDTHGARELVNANLVFERLETLSAEGPKEDLVNCVVRSFLIDLGMAPAEVEPEEVIVLSENDKKIDRMAVRDAEVSVLSPGLAEAFQEPFSPCPVDPNINVIVDSKGEVTKDLSKDSASVAPKALTSVSNAEVLSPTRVTQETSILCAKALKRNEVLIPSNSTVEPSSSSSSGGPCSTNTSEEPSSSSASEGPTSLSAIVGASSSSSIGGPSSSTASVLKGSNSLCVNVNGGHSLHNGGEGISSSNTHEDPNPFTADEGPKSLIISESSLPGGADTPVSSNSTVGTSSEVDRISSASSSAASLGAIPKQLPSKDNHGHENLSRTQNGSKVDDISGSTNGASFIRPSTSGPLVSSPSKRAISEPSNERKRLKISPEKELNDFEFTDLVFNQPDSRPIAGPARTVAAEIRNDPAGWDVGPGGFNSFLGAASKPKSSAAEYVATLNDMFPQADPQYLWDQCEQINDEEAFNALIVSMLSGNYPRFQGKLILYARWFHNASPPPYLSYLWTPFRFKRSQTECQCCCRFRT